MPRRQHDAKDTLPILPFYPRDWRSSTARAVLSPLGRLAYLELLVASWMLPDCALPDSDSQLAGLAQLPIDVWRQVKNEVIVHLPRLDDGRLQQHRIAFEWRKAMANRDAARAAGKAGGEATARKNQEKERKRRSRKPEQMPLDLVADTSVQQACSSPSPSPSPTTTQEPDPSHHPLCNAAPPANDDDDGAIRSRSGSDLEGDPGAIPAGAVLGDRASYIRAVMEKYLSTTDVAARPRSRDYALAESWYVAGIPLPDVVRAIRTVATNRAGSSANLAPIRTLAYFADEVTSQRESRPMVVVPARYRPPPDKGCDRCRSEDVPINDHGSCEPCWVKLTEIRARHGNPTKPWSPRATA